MSYSNEYTGHAAVPDAVQWALHVEAGLSWLRRSIQATGGRGSAHHYSPCLGWAPAYPETSGYLIETLLDYATLTGAPSLRTLAFQCAKWLIEIQLPEGAFTGGTVAHRKPSVFNTAQILFGLARAQAEAGADVLHLQHAGQRALHWLLEQLESDGSWQKAAYRPGFVPSYYTRAVWGVLKAAAVFGEPEAAAPMRQALHYYAARILPNGAVRDWGFESGKPAFTHTIAYTLEGFLESALLLGESEILKQTLHSAAQLWALRTQRGRTAGRYDTGWRGDHTFRCLTGNAQLSVLYYRLWEIYREPWLKTASLTFLHETLPYQRFGGPNIHGGLPGSAPFWGAYMRFRYPNWSCKFLLDALRPWKP